MPTHEVLPASDRPDVEFLVDGVWLPGEVRMQTQLDDEPWHVQVQWQPAGARSRPIDTFAVERVRSADQGVDEP